MKPFAALLLISILFSCSPPLFIAIDENSPTQDAELVNKRFILLSDTSFTHTAQWPDILNKKQKEDFNRRLFTINDPSSRKFLQSVQLMLDKKYQLSYDLLASLPEDAFDCQVLMLKTDCQYLLGNASIDFKERYQKVWDCTPNPAVRSIAKSRFRLVNYGL